MKNNLSTSGGVATIIGIIVIVAVVIALFTIVAFTVFSIGHNTSEVPDSTIQIENQKW